MSLTRALTSEELRILRHMLGIDKPHVRHPKPYRNYYCANPGDPELHALMAAGAVRLYSQSGGYESFTCTEAGRIAAVESQRTIRLGKPKRLYRAFLDVSDSWPDLTFKQFLTDPSLRRLRSEV